MIQWASAVISLFLYILQILLTNIIFANKDYSFLYTYHINGSGSLFNNLFLVCMLLFVTVA